MIYLNKRSGIIIILLLCLAFMTGCNNELISNIPQPNTDIMPENIPVGFDDTIAMHVLFGDKISVSGSGAELQKNVITIFKKGTYVFEGNLQEGQIIVNAESADVHIVFKNVHLTCSYSAALYIKSAARVILTLADGTQNSLSDMASRPSDDSIDGAIYSKSPMAINGNGALSVSGTYKHGISSKEAVTICGGDIAVSALKTGLDGQGDITLSSCTLKVDAGTNGIRSGREDKPANISIRGGKYTITSAGDGMQAYGNIDISDGTIAITTGGGSSEAPVKYSEFSMEGRNTQSVEAEDDTSRKGIKAAGDISISGGSCTVDSYDDGIHADESISISGGTHSVTSGDDGVHGENALLISGGSIDIPYCYEGLEGKSVTITEGTVNIHANDDGINTAADEATRTEQQAPQTPIQGTMPQMPKDMAPPSGMDIPEGFTPPDGTDINQGTGSSMQEIQGDEPSAAPDAEEKGRGSSGKRPSGGNGGRGDKPGGFGGMGKESAQEGVDITISGGTVTISAEGDCIDSNGSIYITGGTVYVSANRYPVISAAEAGLDCNGSLTVSGGSLIGTGTSASQTSGLENAAIVYYGDSAFEADTLLTVSDSAGTTLFEFTPASSFNSVLIASPSLIVGETYTLTIGDLSEQIQLTEQLLTVGESSGGFGFGKFGVGHDAPAQFTPGKTDLPSADGTLSAS